MQRMRASLIFGVGVRGISEGHRRSAARAQPPNGDDLACFDIGGCVVRIGLEGAPPPWRPPTCGIPSLQGESWRSLSCGDTSMPGVTAQVGYDAGSPTDVHCGYACRSSLSGPIRAIEGRARYDRYLDRPRVNRMKGEGQGTTGPATQRARQQHTDTWLRSFA